MSKYFTIDELCHSDTANARGIDNTPTEEVKENLQALIDNVLDPLREAYGKPIYVNSGYRCPALNKAVGGVSASEHLSGRAADIDTHSYSENKKLFELAQELNLPFRQLIDESNLSWVHISYNSNDIKRQVLKL